ncbi:MAG: LytTR family DNA-binding domain-containing protein, partial [Verrucomicrobiota bacterium]
MSESGIRCFVVDDEPLARLRMRQLLEHFSEVSIVGEYESGTDCIEATLEDPPDLIFLDIGLPDHNGLEVVSELGAELDQLPFIVFATAYDEHAIKAFDLNALDYLLKPVQVDRLSRTIERVHDSRARTPASSLSSEEERLRAWMASEGGLGHGSENSIRKLEIREKGTVFFVPVDEVHLFQADGNYIEVRTGNRVHLIRMTMAKLEAQLDAEGFVRVSRSAIVGVRHVLSIEKRQRHDFWVHLDTGDRVGASRNL